MTDFSLDISDADFDLAVIEASHDIPVIVDFWAPWCQPCRVLKPLLEKLAAEYAGRFRLVKINSDENPASAQRCQVRGIPAVKAFVGGAQVDEFTGALPERQVREFIERLMPSKALPLLDAASAALDANDLATAASLLDDAQPVLRDGEEQTRMSALRARLTLAEQGGGDLDSLQTSVAADASNLDARLQLANALAVQGHYEAACEQLLTIVQRDRKWQDEAGRKGLLTLFTLLAGKAEHEALVREYRVKLARTLN